MMAVITDDLTGAAEIAGSALARGFRSVIQTCSVKAVDTDVLIIATNMRSLNVAAAVEKSAQLTEQLLAFNPDVIFKKVDSVLRGHVGPELEAQMRVQKKARALLIPANPSRKRTIIEGTYYVDGQPVAKSGFAESHDFASTTSTVVEILANGGTTRANCVSLGDSMEGDSIFIGNTETLDDLHAWATTISGDFVPAGGVDFFAAILDTRSPVLNGKRALNDVSHSGSVLYVCGSNFPTSRAALAKGDEHSVCIQMPDDIYYKTDIDFDLVDDWAKEVLAHLSNNKNVVITATQRPNGFCLTGRQITQAMAEVARQTVVSGVIKDLMIEGGATSQAVIRALNIQELIPLDSLAPGVTRMQVDGYPDLHVTMKPGSYQWPKAVSTTAT